MARAGKLEEAEKLLKKANKLWQPSILDMRLKPDWEGAAPLFEKAALAFKQSGELEKSRAAYERAAMSQDKIGSTWHAAKHLESASQISRDLGEWGSVADFARQAAGYFAQAGRPTAGADALARGAKQLEEASPSDAHALYKEALDMYEVDGKEGQAGDVFRQAVACLVRNGKYGDAAGLLMRFGEACDSVGARSSQCKAYLGAVVAWLYAQDAREAWQVFQDAMGVDAFSSSDEAFAADALFLSYADGNAEKVKALVQSKAAFRQLDAAVGRLAVKLPIGDLAPQAAAIKDLMGGGAGEEQEGSEDELM
ncbi:Gamma-soluble NSF attachment protein [Monoraphidium neglectum]|uniref:Gamma-soluble NSF attachment protein n=1 Tax=Monoraphidium neglectum TaxID=145388 RepID=A0A0D2KRD2_9CHLO|nr:Gamma-soluble NSF attachment protein [Monoraphidium neglectum]KIY98118.1 Gamma-soluble NSF attachment protein [Monoraphidium neglectum]|eukprot:XP_013897138.1 Gamma-soluble NSF attachment protein [Monoraphidium neglectum]